MLMIDFDEFISNCNDTPSNNEMDQLQKKLQEHVRKQTLSKLKNDKILQHVQSRGA